MKRRLLWSLACSLVLVLAPAAQDTAARKPTDATGRQAQAKETFKELQVLMTKLATALQKTEPDKAKTLQLGTRLVQETQIEADMERVLKLLNEENWDAALGQMDTIKLNLNKLLNLLLNRDLNLKELMEEIERLAEFEKRVDELIKEQKGEKEQSAEVEALEEHLKDLAEARKQIEDLINRQTGIRKDTNALDAKNSDPKSSGAETSKLADKEGALKQDTQSLVDKLGKLEARAAALAAKAAAAKSGDAKGGKPGDGKPGAPKSGESGKSEQIPSDAAPKKNDGDNAKPPLEPPKEGTDPGGLKPSGSGSGQCAGCAGNAVKKMGDAEKKLSDKKPEHSLDDMDKAIEELEKAKKKLADAEEDARRRLMQLPFEQQVKAQDRTMQATDKLADDMDKSGKGKEKDNGEGTPGTRNVQQAVPKQKSAAGSLKEYRASKAKPEQQDAQDQLEEAKKKLEDAIAQLRQQLQDEVLKALEERFAAMLAKQKEISNATKVTDRRKAEALTAPGELPASIQDKCKEMGGGEHELAAEAAAALKLLNEEGSTAVFPEIVQELEADLQKVGDILNTFDTGTMTQGRQKEIEDTLTELIDALRRIIEANDGKGKGQCNGEPPLVPLSAELKMIRSLQKRVNSRTKQYDTDVPVALRATDEGKRDATEISRKQNRVEDLTRKLATKLNKEDEEAAGRGDGGKGEGNGR